MKTALPCLLSLALATGACTDAVAPDPGAGQPADDPTEVSQAVTTTSFTATYTGQGNNATTCNTSFSITGQEPSTTGTFPVFLYMIGTTESSTNASATAAVAGMASRGFVAASIAYNSGTFSNCTTISGKARCIFNGASSTSALSVLCARAKADCSKGVVVGGFSQGAVISTLAKNFDSRVQAAWGMGDGVKYSVFDLTSCMASGNRTLPSNRLRAVDGERDQFIGAASAFATSGDAAHVRAQFQTLTGLSCGSTATNCLQSNGSGWYIVQNGQVADGRADHCYMRATGDSCSGSQNALDAGWQNGTDVWELGANLDWLKTFTTP